MAKKKKKRKKKKTTNYEIYKTIRKDWGEINPTTKIVESKKKYNRKRDSKNIKIEDY